MVEKEEGERMQAMTEKKVTHKMGHIQESPKLAVTTILELWGQREKRMKIKGGRTKLPKTLLMKTKQVCSES